MRECTVSIGIASHSSITHCRNSSKFVGWSSLLLNPRERSAQKFSMGFISGLQAGQGRRFTSSESRNCRIVLGSVTRSIVILHQKVFTEGLPSKWKHCFFQDPPVAHLVESALQNNNWRFCMVVECCPNGHSPASGLNPGLDTCLMVQFIFATPHTNPPIMPVQLETGLIAEYNMLPLGNLDSEVGPGPVQASISVSCGEQGLPHWSPCTQASLDQSGVHQRPGNPDSYGPLPLSSEGVCRCCPAVHAKADQETIIPC